MCTAFSEEWVRGFRDVPHAQQDTTGACEGFHSALKGDELAMKTRLQGRRVDWLLHMLWNEVCGNSQMCFDVSQSALYLSQNATGICCCSTYLEH